MLLMWRQAMSFEEKLVRYIASKLIQKNYFYQKGEFPDDKKLIFYINFVLKKLTDKYKKLSLIRIHSPKGLITPQILQVVKEIKFN